MDLLDLYRGGLTLRRLSVLMGMLERQPTSCYWKALHDSDDWDLANYQRADQLDVLIEGNWQRAANSKSPHPKPVRRPADRHKASAVQDTNLRNALAMRARNRQRKGA